MNYDALTIDTQTVETNGFYFDGGLLGQLKQFKNGQVEVVIAQIIAAEIRRHLRDKTQGAKDSVEAAHKKAQLYGLRNGEDIAFAVAIDTDALAKSRLQKYFDEIGATIVSPDDVRMPDLVKLYVDASPPFARSGKKKTEFPDAIALLSLEHWAKTNKKRILAVSGDADWAAFAEKSEYIDVVAALADALETLQKDLDQADDIAQKLLAGIKSGDNAALAHEFELQLREAVGNTFPYAEADSYYFVTMESIDVQLTRFEIDEDGGYLPARVVQVGRSIIVADLELRIFVDAEATFSLEHHDSTDDEPMSLGSVTANKSDKEMHVDVLVTFEGDFEVGTVTVSNVEVVKGLKSISFGEIEPDYGEPDYEDLREDPEQREQDMTDNSEPF